MTELIEREFEALNAKYDILEGLFAKVYEEYLSNEKCQELLELQKEWKATETYKHYDAKGEEVDRNSDCLNHSDFEIWKKLEETRAEVRGSYGRDKYELKLDMLKHAYANLYTTFPRKWTYEEKLNF